MKILTILMVLYLCHNGIITRVEASIAAEKDLTLVESEKRALILFKNAMARSLNHDDYFLKEAYLIRWLRASKFDVKRAEQMLLENLRWRKEYRMDKIHNEDFTDIDQEFPYIKDIVDKEFQPIVTYRIAEWDFRTAILQGKRNRVRRYIYRLLDQLDIAIKKQQEKGKLVTRGNLLIDLEGYNLIQHACAQCIGLYIELIRAMDNNYPALYDKMILVNVPSIFEALLNIIKQAMTQETRDSMQVFGSSKRTWQNYLLGRIDEDELPLEFGGNYIKEFRNNEY